MGQIEQGPQDSKQLLRRLILEGEPGSSTARSLDFGIEYAAPSRESAEKGLDIVIPFHCESLIFRFDGGTLPEADPQRIELARKVLANGFIWENF